MTNPIVTALVALLAVPGIASALTAVIRQVSDALGVKPRVVVYGVSTVVTGLIGLTGGLAALPGLDSDPTLVVSAWLTWAGATGALAESIYRTLQPILDPAV